MGGSQPPGSVQARAPQGPSSPPPARCWGRCRRLLPAQGLCQSGPQRTDRVGAAPGLLLQPGPGGLAALALLLHPLGAHPGQTDSCQPLTLLPHPSWATAPPEPQFPREPAGNMRTRGKGQGPPRCPRAFGSGEAQRVIWAHPASSAHLNSRVTRVPALPRWPEEWLHPAPCGPLSPSARGLGPPRAAAPTCRQWTVVPPWTR